MLITYELDPLHLPTPFFQRGDSALLEGGDELLIQRTKPQKKPQTKTHFKKLSCTERTDGGSEEVLEDGVSYREEGYSYCLTLGIQFKLLTDN